MKDGFIRELISFQLCIIIVQFTTNNVCIYRSQIMIFQWELLQKIHLAREYFQCFRTTFVIVENGVLSLALETLRDFQVFSWTVFSVLGTSSFLIGGRPVMGPLVSVQCSGNSWGLPIRKLAKGAGDLSSLRYHLLSVLSNLIRSAFSLIGLFVALAKTTRKHSVPPDIEQNVLQLYFSLTICLINGL